MLRKVRVTMTRFVCIDFSWPLFRSFWYRESTFHMGFLCLVFRNKKEGPSAHFAPAISQVPLTQNS